MGSKRVITLISIFEGFFAKDRYFTVIIYHVCENFGVGKNQQI